MEFGEKNVGAGDRLVRGIAGALLLVAVIFRLLEPPLLYAAFVAGALLLGTAYFGTCAVYSLLGISTAGKKKNKG